MCNKKILSLNKSYILTINKEKPKYSEFIHKKNLWKEDIFKDSGRWRQWNMYEIDAVFFYISKKT